MNRKEAAETLKKYNSIRKKSTLTGLYEIEITQSIDSAIEALGETKLKQVKDEVFPFYDVTECCKIGPITTENFCPECGKKIIR